MSWRLLLLLSPLALVGMEVTPTHDSSPDAATHERAQVQTKTLSDRQERAMKERDRQLTPSELAEITLLQDHYADKLGLETPPTTP